MDTSGWTLHSKKRNASYNLSNFTTEEKNKIIHTYTHANNSCLTSIINSMKHFLADAY